MRYRTAGVERELELIPEPRRISGIGDGAQAQEDTEKNAPETVLLPYSDRIVEDLDGLDLPCVLSSQLADDIEAASGLRWDVAHGSHWRAFIRLELDHNLGAGSYQVSIQADGIVVSGGDFETVRDGVQTLRQIIRQCGMALPALEIEDAPGYAVRGYYLDATRGRVPTLDWLKTWADKLCLYKYNQLQLYIEHSFMFDGLSEAWRGVSPLKPADIIAFDEYCARLGIELIPSVSTFGHHYMALRTKELRGLGEFPQDADRPYSLVERQEHHTLNITKPEAFAFSTTLIDAYLELFRTKKFNICADETFDLAKASRRLGPMRWACRRCTPITCPRCASILPNAATRRSCGATSRWRCRRSWASCRMTRCCSIGSIRLKSPRRRSGSLLNRVRSSMCAPQCTAGMRCCRISMMPGTTFHGWRATV
jgi:hypothetical protein